MSRDRSLDIAVVGMSGRFPGAADIAGLWEAVDAGRVLTRRFRREELLDAGVPAARADDPHYVPVYGRLDDSDRFDHAFFGISPREAGLLDPQQRLLLECAWTALEDAGHPFGQGDPLRTGVYASAGRSAHLHDLLAADDLEPPELEEVVLTNERDFLATRISYRLGLTGPALSVLTACSSSLVAVHLAAQALNNGECDQALVLAASASGPQTGHLHLPGGVMSAEGQCRPFDTAADGTLSGSGVVAVVLRRYEDAVDGHLPVHGVVLGSAVNNDGSTKAGFLAPSAEGQEQVIRSAVATAGIDAATIGYLEAHGTGTRIGDPIEWSAASAAYRSLGAGPGSIAVGALKGVTGHLDTAAGLAGLVKALLVVGHGRVPAVPGLVEPNPLLDLEGSPLRLPAGAEPWRGPEPRRAAVSSFGVGGTNAHVIVEQAPVPVPADRAAGGHRPGPQLVVLSAADEEALGRMRTRLADHLAAVPDGDPAALADISGTLAGRAALAHRSTVVGSTVAEVAARLRAPAARAATAAPRTTPLVFLLPGQGTQVPGMALPFEAALPGFGPALSACLDAFSEDTAKEVEQALRDPGFPRERLAQTRLAQPALFAVEYAAAAALRHVGLVPSVLLGHSLGELTAACLAGTLPLEAAARLVEHRGHLMQECPEGAMVSLACSEAEAVQLVSAHCAPLALAAVNTWTDTVLAGTPEAVHAFHERIADRVPSRVLRTGRAFHSALVEPAVTGLRTALAQVATGPADLPWVRTTDGAPVRAGSVVDAGYFADSAGSPVRFAQALAAVRAEFPGARAVEVGPGRVLSAFAEAAAIPSVPLCPTASAHPGPGPGPVLAALGELWSGGMPVDLTRIQPRRRHARLPGYPFHGPRWPRPTARRTVAPGTAEPQTGATPRAEGRDAPAPAPAPAPASGSQAPEEPAVIVRELWFGQLGDVPLSGDADFFDLGGDSLSAARLARAMGRAFGIEVSVRDLLTQRTLDAHTALAERLLVEQILGESEEDR
ncbi:type I polyketide synthase [Streptomyces sp. NPDC058646]|uniref:type I polyketide synthase n=1 Tax=Streptomyces sp. NPDC058646 TaxID=3346574 RepID=UPI003656356C